MEPNSPFNTVSVRRNPHRRARPTPSSTIPFSIPPADIPTFPIGDILSIQIPQNPQYQHSSSQNSTSTSTNATSNSTSVSENLQVFLRIRPLFVQQNAAKKGARSKNVWPQNPKKSPPQTKPKKKNEIACIRVNDDSHSVTLCPSQSLQDLKRTKSEVYQGFSHVFSADSSQLEVYERMVNPLVEDFLSGKSGMLAALGPSGSGKTHTVFGCAREPGMVPLALRRIFSPSDDQSSRKFYLSMFEISSERGKTERMFDLMQEGGDLCMQQSMVKGLQEVVIHNVQQAESLITVGMAKRTTAKTNSNNQSSRSQCIISIRCGSNNMDGEIYGQSNCAVLTIVDLAGAEREKRTGNQGARLQESNFINNTSMVFGLCLRSLLEHQKNPKKPLQKHFQSSLLTRYLRDYLEGKKRMALILTVRPDEEDYLDTSFLLRQASPYMQIKFNNAEENFICNKRHIQALPRTVQIKKMKFDGPEGCVVEWKTDRDDQHLKREVPDKARKSKLLKVTSQPLKLEVDDQSSSTDSAKMERKNQIMQDFAKAIWNVLKEYKKKLEMAENEIHCLKESLKNEKIRFSKLEEELKNLKCCYSPQKEPLADVSAVEVDASRAIVSFELEEYQYPNTRKNETDLMRSESTETDSNIVAIDEVSSIKMMGSQPVDDEQISDSSVTASSSNVSFSSCTVKSFEQQFNQGCENSLDNEGNTEDIKDVEDMRKVDIHFSGESSDLNLEVSEYCGNGQRLSTVVFTSCNVINCEPQVYQGGASETVDNTEDIKDTNNMRGVDALSPGESSFLDHEESEFRNNEQRVNTVAFASYTVESFEQQLYQGGQNSSKNVDNSEDLKDINKIRRVDTHSTGVLDLEGSEYCNNEQRAKTFVSASCTVESCEQQLHLECGNSSENVNDTVDVMGVVDMREVNAHSTGESSVLNFEESKYYGHKERVNAMPRSSDAVSNLSVDIDKHYNQKCESPAKYVGNTVRDWRNTERENTYSNIEVTDSRLLLSGDCSSQSDDIAKAESLSVEGDQLQNLELKPSISKEGVAIVRECNVSNAHTGTTGKPLNAEKPKRRLLPASSILLRNVSGWDLEDETNQQKGHRGEKKLAVEDATRTQGSISLLRLLQSNLHL